MKKKYFTSIHNIQTLSKRKPMRKPTENNSALCNCCCGNHPEGGEEEGNGKRKASRAQLRPASKIRPALPLASANPRDRQTENAIEKKTRQKTPTSDEPVAGSCSPHSAGLVTYLPTDKNINRHCSRNKTSR